MYISLYSQEEIEGEYRPTVRTGSEMHVYIVLDIPWPKHIINFNPKGGAKCVGGANVRVMSE